jgi:hypothetical protein
VLDSLRRGGARVARITSFASMAVVRGRPGTRVVEVRAVEPGFPFYGVIDTRPASQWGALERGANALVDPSLLVALDARIGDTLQLGIGAVPNAILAALRSHSHLGVHTEMLSDGIVDLVERGVITCSRKRYRPYKIVCSFAMGTRRLYDFVDDNPFVECFGSDLVCGEL